jgi:hypothetical protein
MKYRYFLKIKLTLTKLALVLFIAFTFLPCLYSSKANELSNSDVIFIENKGQIIDDKGNARNDILYYTNSGNVNLYFTKSGIYYVFTSIHENLKPDYDNHSKPEQINQVNLTTCRTGLSFVNMNQDVKISSENEISQYFNYYYPHCPNGITNVKAYKKILYENIYKNIDLVFYNSTKNNGIKYDFIVKPGADIAQIKLKYSDYSKIMSQTDGSVRISNEIGFIEDSQPLVYQKANSDKIQSNVPCSYKIDNDLITFNINDYDKTKPLIIDPNLIWSTYYGGTGGDHGTCVVLDKNYNVIIAGYTLSTNFPTTPGAFQTTRGLKSYDAIIVKFDINGNVLWSTYYGGIEWDQAESMCADQNNNIYITGFTWSSNFPISVDALQGTFGGGQIDGFIVKFDQLGNRIWGTYYGGSLDEHFYGIAHNQLNELALTGWTQSREFRVGPYSFAKNSSINQDAFLVTMSDDGAFVNGTYIGGDDIESGQGVVYERNNDIIFAGFTRSQNFPLKSNDPNDKSRPEVTDIFVTRFNFADSLKPIVYSKVFGGNAIDGCYGITLDTKWNILLTGKTNSINFPVIGNTFQRIKSSVDDAFVMKLDTNALIIWSTYLGGSSYDQGNAIATDKMNNAIIVGKTESSDIPMSNSAFQKILSGPNDAFAAKFDTDGNFQWSTYIGGINNEWGWGITTDGASNVIITGATESIDFPVTSNAIQKKLNINIDPKEKEARIDAFILKFCASEPEPEIKSLNDMPLTFCPGDSVILLATDGFDSYLWSNGDRNKKIVVKDSGVFTVSVWDSNGCIGTSPPAHIVTYPQPNPKIIGKTEFCQGDSTYIEVSADFEEYNWSNGKNIKGFIVNSNEKLVVTVKDSNGCTGKDSVIIKVNPLPKPRIKGFIFVCAGSKGVWYEVTGFPNHSFIWNVEGGNIVYGVDKINVTIDWGNGPSGKIYVRELNELTGCVGYDTMEVTIGDKLQPKITSNTGKFSFCEGDSLILDGGAGYYTYFWEPNRETSQTITVKTPGIYYLTVKDNSTCQGMDSIIISEIPNPRPVITGNKVVCENSLGEFYETPNLSGNSYTWTVGGGNIINGNGTNRIEVKWNRIGKDTLQVLEKVDSAGCFGLSEVFEITVYPNPIPKITLNGPSAFCEGDSTELFADEGYEQYHWSNGATSQKIIVKSKGDYSVTVTDINGCTGSSNTFVSIDVYSLPLKPVITRIEDTLNSSNSIKYQWNYEGNSIAGANDSVYQPQNQGNYSVTITDKNGCKSTSDPIYFTKGSVGGWAVITLPDTIFAKIGENIKIPIEIINSKFLNYAKAHNFKAYFRFNKSVINPLKDRNYTGSNSFEDIIRIDGIRISDTIGIIAQPEFMVTWGDEACSAITLDSVIWEGAIVVDSLIPGVICITDLCQAGGTRLFQQNNELFLKQNRPNPFSSETEIEFSTIEQGYTRLYILDMMGQKINTLFEGESKPDIYKIKFDAGTLTSGIYFYVLQNPTQTLVKRMEIIK